MVVNTNKKYTEEGLLQTATNFCVNLCQMP
ncbi:Uncharacterised protein [Streptococcus suis]|uniref:Uncharacterized protein n=1 Tax=Streptococcus suis TaxID=1307 RepID=A0A116S0I2_STRSU|nr:Uncharacterised protein [Streptococcus suis]